jgi:hypothetical protein
MRWLPLTLACAFFAGCDSHKLLPFSENVLTDGMTLHAEHPNGPITVRAGSGTERTFSGPGWSKTRYLIPRSTRWNGSLGLYEPADSYFRAGRLIAEEGRLFFQTESEALRYLYVGSDYLKPTYTNTGLVVSYAVGPIIGGEATRNVKVWQIYIGGKQPTSLKGADDTAITLTGGSISPTAAPYPASNTDTVSPNA